MSHKNTNRTDRVGSLIHREVANIMSRYSDNSSFSGVTVTAVRMSKDLSYAKIFVTFLDKTDIKMKLASLNKETYFIRHILAKNLYLRALPKLGFVYDDSIDYGVKLSALIDAAIAKDETNSNF